MSFPCSTMIPLSLLNKLHIVLSSFYRITGSEIDQYLPISITWKHMVTYALTSRTCMSCFDGAKDVQFKTLTVHSKNRSISIDYMCCNCSTFSEWKVKGWPVRQMQISLENAKLQMMRIISPFRFVGNFIIRSHEGSRGSHIQWMCLANTDVLTQNGLL